MSISLTARTWSEPRCVCAADRGSAVGPALLRGWRYVIAGGYGTVAPAAGMRVFGVLWRLAPRDLATLNAYESLDSGLYRRMMLTVEIGGQRARALVYVGTQARPAPPDARLPGAARRGRRRTGACQQRYVAELARLAPGYRAARPAETGEMG